MVCCKTFLTLMLLSTAVNSAVSSNILLLPHWNASHLFEMAGVARPLAERGHKVFLLMDEDIELPKSITFPRISHKCRIPPTLYYNNQILQNEIYTMNAGLNMSTLLGFVKATCINLVSDQDLFPKLRSLQFDLAIIDSFNTPCFYLVPYILRIPFVTVGTIFSGWTNRVPTLPAIVQPVYGLDLIGLHFCIETDEQWSIVRRLCRSAALAMADIIMYNAEDEYLRQYVDFPSIQEIRDNVSLALVNSGYLLSNPMPKLPHVEYVGGLTTGPAKPLEPELHKWMSQAANVVVVSFGTYFASLPPYVATKLFDGFAQMPEYRFLFRFKIEGGNTFKVSSNVRLMDWLPQNDALGHNSTRLFVTHSGNNGQQEALYHGKPMLCFHIFADQKTNALRVTQRGFGRMLSVQDFSTSDFVTNVRELLLNTTYSDRIRKASAIFHSEKHPAERAADAVEHVLKFGGEHLRPKEAYKLAWWQFYMLDVFAVVYGALLVILVVLYKLSKCVLSRLFGRVSGTKLKNKTE